MMIHKFLKRKAVSCGLVVVSPGGILLGRATKTNKWDIPKGRKEKNETSLEAALREAQEETSIDFSPFKKHFVDLGEHYYLPHKSLHTFRLNIEETIELSKCFCSTFVRRGVNEHPEMDKYAWVQPEEIHIFINPSLLKYLLARGVIEPEYIPSSLWEKWKVES